jgi:hypothetical protein
MSRVAAGKFLLQFKKMFSHRFDSSGSAAAQNRWGCQRDYPYQYCGLISQEIDMRNKFAREKSRRHHCVYIVR